jgi:hypothetical protein
MTQDTLGAEAVTDPGPANDVDIDQWMTTTGQTIAYWLLNFVLAAPVDGSKGRGVVNWLDSKGDWDALYPEIAGYYLQFLAILGSTFDRSGECLAHATSIVEWLDEISLRGPPRTRYHRIMKTDWRNGANFSFDMAMILRGLGKIGERFPQLRRDDLIDRYHSFVIHEESATLLSSHKVVGPAVLPERWSTTFGLHQLKSAAAIGSVFGIATGKEQQPDIVENTIEECLSLFRRQLKDRHTAWVFHQLFYFAEGALMLHADSELPWLASAALDALNLAVSSSDSGASFYDSAGTDEAVERSDVIAQALRVASILAAGGLLDRTEWPILRSWLLNRLACFVDPNGGVRFDNSRGHTNAWAALFVWQALYMARVESDAWIMASELI